MDTEQPNFFSGPYIDRRAEEREHPDWARRALEDPRTLFLVASGTRHLVYTQPEPRIAFLDGAMPAALAAADPSCLVLLGWFRERRCVLPADGYYEWQATPGGKQPYFLHLDNTVLNMAGLYELWRDPDKDNTDPPAGYGPGRC